MGERVKAFENAGESPGRSASDVAPIAAEFDGSRGRGEAIKQPFWIV